MQIAWQNVLLINSTLNAIIRSITGQIKVKISKELYNVEEIDSCDFFCLVANVLSDF